MSDSRENVGQTETKNGQRLFQSTLIMQNYKTKTEKATVLAEFKHTVDLCKHDKN